MYDDVHSTSNIIDLERIDGDFCFYFCILPQKHSKVGMQVGLREVDDKGRANQAKAK